VHNCGTSCRVGSPARALHLNPDRTIELQKDPRLPNVEHDSDQIHQLLLNAVQAIDNEGTIRGEEISHSLSKGDAAITVVDTRRGIAPEHLAHIFRLFYTTEGNGTGRWDSRWPAELLKIIPGD
jgi:signal transduction histidine kinase